MPAIPPFVLKKLYVRGSLRAEGDGFALDLCNSIAPGAILGLAGLELDGAPVPPGQVTVVQPDGQALSAEDISPTAPLRFPLGATLTLQVAGLPLGPGDHKVSVRVIVQDVGPLEIPVADKLG